MAPRGKLCFVPPCFPPLHSPPQHPQHPSTSRPLSPCSYLALVPRPYPLSTSFTPHRPQHPSTSRPLSLLLSSLFPLHPHHPFAPQHPQHPSTSRPLSLCSYLVSFPLHPHPPPPLTLHRPQLTLLPAPPLLLSSLFPLHPHPPFAPQHPQHFSTSCPLSPCSYLASSPSISSHHLLLSPFIPSPTYRREPYWDDT